jgi:cell division transport system permease protein
MVKFIRAVKTAVQYILRNFGLSFASIIVMTLSFFIVSVVGLAFYASMRLVRHVDAKPALTVFLRGDLKSEQATEFANIVNQTGLVREVDVKDIDFAKNDFNQKYPKLEGVINDENKSNLTVVAFIYGNSQENLKTLIDNLSNNENFMENLVDKKNFDKTGWYSFNNEQAEVIRDANRLLRTSGLAITLFLFVISSILVFITIRLTIQYHRKELEIMDLVGADRWFINLPFIIDGIIYGILGALLSNLIIFVFKNYLIEKSPKLVPKLNDFFSEIQWPSVEPKLVLQLMAITLLTGALVGALSSFLAVFRYARK